MCGCVDCFATYKRFRGTCYLHLQGRTRRAGKYGAYYKTGWAEGEAVSKPKEDGDSRRGQGHANRLTTRNHITVDKLYGYHGCEPPSLCF